MSEFSQMQKRLKLDNMMNYLIYGCTADLADGEPVKKDLYQKRIDQAFDKLFQELNHMFPSASRDCDELYSAVLHFAMAHQEVYTEMGFLAGCRFWGDLQRAGSNIGKTGMQSIVKEVVFQKDGAHFVEMEDGSLFEVKSRQVK